MNNQAQTMYVFKEKDAEILVARTTDVRELKNFMTSDWIAKGENVLINEKTYSILHITIEPFLGNPELYQPDSKNYYDFGTGGYWTVQTTIFLSPSKA